MPTWDPARYLQFADDRARPYLDLIGQIRTTADTIVDLGCGTGSVTRHLRTFWPDAEILGIDSSPEMVDVALRENCDAHLNYDIADVATWEPFAPVDLMVSNAMFQWVPDQFTVIDRLLGFLTDGGSFAVQVPNNTDTATHTSVRELAETEPYRSHLADIRPIPAIEPEDYLEFFAERGFAVNAWSTTYRHILHGDDPVFDWISATGARPYLQALDDDLRDKFTQDLKTCLRHAYPARPYGTVLPFQRTFAVASPQA
ncbi:methyltransferase domain-containing protein [Gordonia amarae]|uniref:methyltransferase domain-containing protein n=1 Tax=Gordonia amarae TaxID=36821 RepID=UPI001AF4A0E7|nr:methyltransferase domain-containing protein [Gordonia amarae]QHN29247.1 methyltransferase domain-containing protein [Gordonia amarae]